MKLKNMVQQMKLGWTRRSERNRKNTESISNNADIEEERPEKTNESEEDSSETATEVEYDSAEHDTDDNDKLTQNVDKKGRGIRKPAWMDDYDTSSSFFSALEEPEEPVAWRKRFLVEMSKKGRRLWNMK